MGQYLKEISKYLTSNFRNLENDLEEEISQKPFISQNVTFSKKWKVSFL